MASLRDRLQKSLGDAYRLERELGGGGMSKVFVADELSLGRKVVVKVLSPELAAEISVERFRREIQVSARLQHPHVVPVLSSGIADGHPYYTMPFVEGESLRARLARDGALPIGEAVPILRDVARALEYAHSHGVVHRDIKPDNVLLAGSSATVADFGIAKAVSDARTVGAHATLTSVGTALGTPSYIAPEQAAGDAAVDHRADLYSFGCMAYEMLAGQTPFGDRPPQRLFVAHMSERPRPLGDLRPDAPPQLVELVMRCLEKEASARPQTATELLRVLETVVSSGGHDAVPVIARATRRSLGMALLWWVAAFVAVTIVTKAAIIAIGLPSWALPGAVVLMLLGLPLILFTSFIHHRTRVARTMAATLTPGGTAAAPQSTLTRIALKASPWLSWRRSALVGAWAFGAFVITVGGWLAMRELGIGPAGSLFAAGVLNRNEKILVADFQSPASDTSLGSLVTEALRTDLAQSRTITPVQPTAVRDMLRRMQRPNIARVDFAVARELATREGIKAVIAGEILEAGGQYIIAARLHATQTGDVLAAFRETADGAKGVIPAIDRLSRALREKIGDNLRLINATPALGRVTTNSLEALKKYTQGVRAIDVDGDYSRGLQLLEEAITLDTAFAAAYRKVATQLGNRGIDRAKQRLYYERAFAHSDRLSDLERYLTMGSYYTSAEHWDAAKAITAYEAMDEIDPHLVTSNNLAVIYGYLRETDKAVEFEKRAIANDSSLGFAYTNLAGYLTILGRWDESEKIIGEYARRFPRRRDVTFYRSLGMYHKGLTDSAAILLRAELRQGGLDPQVRRNMTRALGALAYRAGHLKEGDRLLGEASAVAQAMGDRAAPLALAAALASNRAWFLHDGSGALRLLDDALKGGALDSLPEADRPLLELANAYALAGKPERARTLTAAFDRANPKPVHPNVVATRHGASGLLAIAERRYADAVRELRASDVGSCVLCAKAPLAQAYDLAEQSDSAIAAYETFLSTPAGNRGTFDASFLAPTHKRLGELYEAKGERDKALAHYRAFVELWKTADPELQPAVQDVRQKLAKLEKAGG